MEDASLASWPCSNNDFDAPQEYPQECLQDCCFLNLISILAETHLNIAKPGRKGYIFNKSRLRSPGRGNFRLFHEIGHNMQRDAWTPSYHGEVTNEIFALYIMEKGKISLFFLLACAQVFIFVCCLFFHVCLSFVVFMFVHG